MATKNPAHPAGLNSCKRRSDALLPALKKERAASVLNVVGHHGPG